MSFKETKRKGFNFFRSYYDVYNELETDADKVAFIDALLDRQFLGSKPSNLTGMAKFAWISQVNSIDSQIKGYEDKTGIKLTPPSQGGTQGGTQPPCQQVQVQVQGKVQEQVKGKVKEKVKKEGVYSDEVNTCFENCLKFFPEHLHPKKNVTWLDTIEKLHRIEKLPFEVIESITKKTRENDFWAKNFLSLTKLRKTNKDGVKYVVVFNEQIKSNQNGKTTKTTQTDIDNLRAISDRRYGKN